MANDESEDIFEVAARIRRLDMEARVQSSIGGEDALWLTDRLRKMEQRLDTSRQVQRTLQAQNEKLEGQIDGIRRTHLEWETKLWNMNDAYREALDKSESELEELNATVQEVLRHHIPVEPQVALSPNPDVRSTQESEVLLANHSSAALVCSQGLAQLSEMSEEIAVRQDSGKVDQALLDEYAPEIETKKPSLKQTHHMHYFVDDDEEGPVPSLSDLDFVQKATTNLMSPEPLIGRDGRIILVRSPHPRK